MSHTLQIRSPLITQDVELHLLDEKHISTLEKLSQDERLWKFAPHPLHKNNLFREKWVAKALSQIKANDRVCFVIFYQGNIVGSTSYYHIDLENKNVTIGYTWIHPDYWGSKINRLIKLMMFEHAFEKLGYIRVEFQVDSLNIPSQNALLKLEIKHEGILRNHMVLSDGRIRHTYIYSVIPEEWPEIRRNIEALI